MAFAFQPRPEQVTNEEQLTCSACKIAVLPTERHSHYRSDWHRYNLKRKCVDMPPIDRAVFEAKLQSIIAGGQSMQMVSNKKKKKASNKTIQSNYDSLTGSDQWQLQQLSSTLNSIKHKRVTAAGGGGSGSGNGSDVTSSSLQLLTYQCTLCHKTFKTHQQCVAHLHTKKHRGEFSKYHRNLRSLQQDEIDVFRATNHGDGQEEASCVADVVEYELNAANGNANANDDQSNKKQKHKKQQQPMMMCVENNPFITVKQAKLMRQKLRGVHAYDDKEEKTAAAVSVAEAVAEDDEDEANGDMEGNAPRDMDIDAPNGDADDANGAAQRVAIDTRHRCLFCTHSVEEEEDENEDEDALSLSCLQHMCDEHGFFIPLPRRVTSMSRLLRLAGEIIGVYHQCVWCWKIFKSVRGCQAHMRHTTHCKLQLEYSSSITYASHAQREDVNIAVVNEDDVSPFVAFIDFDKHISDDEDWVDASAVLDREMGVARKPRGRIVDVTDCAELIRDDGTRIGHRDRALAYRQKHGNLVSYQETQSEEQIIAQINNPQRKLKLMQMELDKRVQQFEDSGIKTEHKHGKVKEKHAMSAQTRRYKVVFQNWVNLQKSKQLYM